MAMFASWLTALLLMVWIRREMAAGRSVFDLPRRWLAKLHRKHMLFALAIVGLMVGLVWLMKADGAMIIALGWPEIATLAASFDVPALLDLAVIAIVSAGQARLGTPRRTRGGARPRSNRVSRRRTSVHAANDDEDRRRRAA